jgi:hypothetical protein
MPKYFTNFPKVKHTNEILVDITKRAKFLNTIAQNPNVYLPYTIKDGETVEEISYLYYGTVDYVWMIYLANNMIDPYKDWPMRDRELYAHIADKYKDEYEESTGNTTYSAQDVLNWTQDATRNDNILFYRSLDSDEEIKLSPESYALGSKFDAALIGEDRWTPVRVFDAEVEANEDKRVIQLINDVYAEQVAKEFESLMND